MLSNSCLSPISTFQSIQLHLTPLCHPLTLTYPLLFPLHRILDNSFSIFTPFCRLLMPRCRALALPRRSLTPPHCPLTFSLSPFIVS